MSDHERWIDLAFLDPVQQVLVQRLTWVWPVLAARLAAGERFSAQVERPVGVAQVLDRIYGRWNRGV